MDEFAEINVTPFTDVLLVLLIIFMVLAAIVAPAGFERRIPNCNCGRFSQKLAPPKAELVIARNGRMELDGRILDERTIYGALSALQASRHNVALSIYGDRLTEYAHIIRAMDAAKAARITNVSFVSI